MDNVLGHRVDFFLTLTKQLYSLERRKLFLSLIEGEFRI